MKEHIAIYTGSAYPGKGSIVVVSCWHFIHQSEEYRWICNNDEGKYTTRVRISDLIIIGEI